MEPTGAALPGGGAIGFGAMLIDSRCVPDVIGLLKPEDFYLQQNREIYETIYTMFHFSQVIDPVTVLDKMQERGCGRRPPRSISSSSWKSPPPRPTRPGMPPLSGTRPCCAPWPRPLRRFPRPSMRESARPRRFWSRRSGRFTPCARASGARAWSPSAWCCTRCSTASRSWPSPTARSRGVSTGLVDLDRKINGLNRSDLLLIAARPAMGKTSFALNIALHVAKKYRQTVAFFSLEMSREQLAMRLLSGESFVDSQKMATGKLSDEEWTKLAVASAALSQTDIRVDDNPSITVAEMNAKCRRLDNLGLVLIDYLQLMTGSGYGRPGENRVTVVSEISRALKIMAKELNVPVICLSQLSRANESRQDKRPILSDLRESGAIEQDADEVLFLYRDDYYNENSEEKNVAECIVSKNRHGETGTVKLQWLPQYTTFADREWRHTP